MCEDIFNPNKKYERNRYTFQLAFQLNLYFASSPFEFRMLMSLSGFTLDRLSESDQQIIWDLINEIFDEEQDLTYRLKSDELHKRRVLAAEGTIESITYVKRKRNR